MLLVVQLFELQLVLVFYLPLQLYFQQIYLSSVVIELLLLQRSLTLLKLAHFFKLCVLLLVTPLKLHFLHSKA